jgi:hypothetical protein
MPLGGVKNAFNIGKTVNEADQAWQYTASGIGPDKYLVTFNRAITTVFSQQREFIVQLFPENPNRALVYTQAPDSILERPVLSGEKRPEFAIDIDNINNPKSLSIELTIPEEFNTENILKIPFFKLELIENEAIPSINYVGQYWQVQSWCSQAESNIGAGSLSVFRASVNVPGTARPAQTEGEAVGADAANQVLRFTPIATTVASTLVSGTFNGLGLNPTL